MADSLNQSAQRLHHDDSRRYRLGLLLVLLGSLLIRLPLLAVPLERDEGEYAYVAQQMAQGTVPYRHLVSSKPPGLFLIYRGILGLFGESVVGLHRGLACYTVLTLPVLYRLGADLWHPRAGLLAAAAGVALLRLRRRVADDHRWLIGWLAAAALSLAPGRFFLAYYFILLAPPIAILAALGLVRLMEAVRERWRGRAGRAVAWLSAMAIAASPVIANAETLGLSPQEIAYRLYEANPFVEAEALGRYLAVRTRPEETILVVGSEPEIFFYARRRSATKYVFFYPLTGWSPRAAAMQGEFFEEIERARPRYLVMMNLTSSWLTGPFTHRALFDRLGAFAQERYALEAALVWREERPYALLPATQVAELGGARIVASILRRTE